jgi:tRNA A-37 threonylcarbamoyl transferase component Bud32/tetratricopeptide (TPR) repeat protein
MDENEQPTEPGPSTLRPGPADDSGATTAHDRSRAADATGDFTPVDDRTNPLDDRAGAGDDHGRRIHYFGDYELIDVLGRGGMGVVYRARQISLDRLVAIKMIANAEFAGEEQLRRFRVEAEAVAMLDHPGIVPVLEVGSFEDRRYLSMKLIDGRPLSEALVELKSDPREAARVVADVAGAVHHAHQRGILHRDLKPANILLDRAGRPYVTDFGLAKRTKSDEGLTVTGAVLGTPSYMSPEQASGKAALVTVASDVYGLGAVLFATLTGRAPFVGDSVVETIDRVRNVAPEPPRRLNPTVPRDLEVICLKCLEKDPGRRYASAGDLADDLRRWLLGEPIRARSVSLPARLGMWARRKPALAGLSAALAVASVVGVIGVVSQWREAVHQRKLSEASAKLAREQRQAANAQERLARSQATIALDSLQDMINIVQDKLDRPGLYDLKEQLNAIALQRINLIVTAFEQASRKDIIAFRALDISGRLSMSSGQIKEAVPIFRRCLEMGKEQLDATPHATFSWINLSNIYWNLGDCLEEVDRDMAGAVESLKKGEELLDHVIEKKVYHIGSLSPIEVMSRRARLHHRTSQLYIQLGQMDAALGYAKRAYEFWEGRLAEKADELRATLEGHRSALAVANVLHRLGRRAEAEVLFRRSQELGELAARLDPESYRSRFDLAYGPHQHGVALLLAGDLGGARPRLEAARDVFADLAKRDKGIVSHRVHLARVHDRLGQLAEAEGRADLARQEFEEAARRVEENAGLDPDNDLRRYELAYMLPRAGGVARVDRAVEVADRLAAGTRVDAESQIFLAQAYAQASRALPPEQADRAAALVGKAVESIRKAIGQSFADRLVLEGEPDLAPIRGGDAFRALLGQLPAQESSR